jgi:hypothetical protein
VGPGLKCVVVRIVLIADDYRACVDHPRRDMGVQVTAYAQGNVPNDRAYRTQDVSFRVVLAFADQDRRHLSRPRIVSGLKAIPSVLHSTRA